MAGLLWYRSYMDSLANTSGYYPDIHAGHADRVTELTLDAPYLIRETPAGYNQLELMELVGGSVAWNQLVQNNDYSNGTTGWSCNNGGIVASNGELIYTPNAGTHGTNFGVANGWGYSCISGHKYLYSFSLKINDLKGKTATYSVNGTSYPLIRDMVANTYKDVFGMFAASSDATVRGFFYPWGNQAIEYSGAETAALKNFDLIDLTQMLGPTIADYIYSLEQATAGSGIACLKSYGYFTEDYYAYSAPTLQSVEATSHIAKDGNGNVINTTTFGSVTLRGILMKDADGSLYYDGDTYESDGTVTRKYGYRAYQNGDVSDGSTMITDGTNTIYKLNTPTTESADPFTAVQTVEEGGTEEFVTSNNVPVGNVSVYRRA